MQDYFHPNTAQQCSHANGTILNNKPGPKQGYTQDTQQDQGTQWRTKPTAQCRTKKRTQGCRTLPRTQKRTNNKRLRQEHKAGLPMQTLHTKSWTQCRTKLTKYTSCSTKIYSSREVVFMERPLEPNMGPSLADVLLCTFESTNAGFSSFPVKKLLS